MPTQQKPLEEIAFVNPCSRSFNDRDDNKRGLLENH